MNSQKTPTIRVLNKLARNNLHENLAARGATAVTRILSDDEYQVALYKKAPTRLRLSGPSGSASFAGLTKELADVLEVVHALAPLIAGSMEELEKVRIAKREYRGGFDKKLFVEEIHEK